MDTGSGQGAQTIMDNMQTFVRFEQPIKTTTNKQPTAMCEIKTDGTSKPLYDLPQNSPFVAVGRAQSAQPGAPTYYMDAESFGSADTTGEPTVRQGINSIDLTLDASEDPDAPQKVDVRVVPPDPNKWMQSYHAYPSVQVFDAQRDCVIRDIAGIEPDRQVVKGTVIKAAGEFTKDGVDYIRTDKSVREGKWYGIPTNMVDDDKDLDNLSEQTIRMNTKQKTVAKIATIEGFFSRLFKHK